MAIPKIALIPSGVKAGKLYSVLPTNGDGDFTTTRSTVATRVNENGLIEEVASNVPRLDYSDGSCPSLLLEPTATNLITQSNQFDTTWISVNVTLNSGQTGVGGSNDAWKVTSTSGVDYLRYNSNNWLGDTVFSVYAKAGTLNSILMTGFGNTYFNLETGVVGTSTADSAKIEPMGNGWYRCSIAGNTSPSQVRLYPSDLENSSAVGSIYIQYAQVEERSYATSYIKTIGTTQTRVADTASKTGLSSLIGQTEGTIFLDFNNLDYSFSSISRGLSISDGSYTNRIYIAQLDGGAMYAVSSTGCEIQESNPSSRREVIKVALGYKNNDYIMYVNGVQVGSDNSATVPLCDKIYLGQEIGLTANCLNKPINNISLYNTRLSNSELQALTTI